MTKNYRNAFFFLILVQIFYFAPILFKAEVIFPHNNTRETHSTILKDDEHISNRKFTDQSWAYIPEINHHLNGNSHAWLSTWNPYVQLGRPAYHLCGFSKAYLTTHLLSLFTNNPFVLYTSLTVLSLFLTGVFLFLFLKTLGLCPLACSIAAIGLSTGVFVSYWLTFVMFIGPICWSLCLLWLITKFLQKRSYLVAVGISFATYSLLLTGYPQFTVLQTYLISAYSLIYLWKSYGKAGTKLYTALMLIGSAVLGLIMASPVFLDLAVNAQRSARLSTGDEFFLGMLPGTNSFKYLGMFLFSIFDPFWVGNPIERGYPYLSFNGLCLTPLYFGLFLLSFFYGQWRKLWPWQLFAILCLIATVWPKAYLFMVHYMGFHLSRLQPLSGALLPAFVLCGYAVDYIMRNKPDKTPSLIKPVVFILPLYLIGVLTLLWLNTPKLSVIYIMICCGVTAGLLCFVRTRKPILLQILSVVAVFAYSSGLMLTRPLEQIQTSSPLVKRVQAQTHDGSRYAKVGRKVSYLFPPNEEALLKIKSIHSYDSLSSRNYQRLVLQLSEKGTISYGRFFISLSSSSKLSDPAFSYSGVGLLLSRDPNGVKFTKTPTRPLLYTQTKNFHKVGNQIIFRGFLREHSELKVEQIAEFDDFRKFKVTRSDQKTILFVSQQYHPYWKASSRGKALETMIINDFYQGVVIPPHTHEVQLEFRSYVLWSWLPQLLYILFALGSLVNWMKKRYSKLIK